MLGFSGARVLGFGVFAAVAVVVVTAAPQGAQQTPVFRTGVDRVAVDFVAVARDGQPIADLTSRDLTLKVDGKLREIRSLELVRLVPAAAPPASALAPAEAVPAPFGSNAPAEAGRAIILVFHHTALRPGEERPAKVAAAAFLNTLRPRDRVALVTFQEGGVVVDLTTDHARVLKGMQSISGHAPLPNTFIPAYATPPAAAEGTAVKNLSRLLDSFSTIDGPKTVVFISGGLPSPTAGTVTRNMDRMYEYQDVGKAAARAHAQVFVIVPHALRAVDAAVPHLEASNGFESTVNDGLEAFAGVTGGTIFRVAGGAQSPFERVALESSAYYLLSFDAESRERDGKNHKISVATARRDITIRARPEFQIEKAGTASAAPPPATQTRTLLKDLKTYRDLPLRAVAYAFRAPSGQATVIVAADTAPGIRIAAASYALIDDTGKVVGMWDADAADLSTNPVVSATTIAPGSYRLRVAAVGDDGRLGAVDYEFRAALADAGPLKSGGLMLGRMEGARFVPQLDFASDDAATAYVEVYGKVPPGEKATVTIEVAATADGKAVLTVPAAITDTMDDDRWIATADLPLTSLGPGDHVVRAIVKVGGASGTIVRTLRKVR